jgi:hypothetical protein
LEGFEVDDDGGIVRDLVEDLVDGRIEGDAVVGRYDGMVMMMMATASIEIT